MLCEVEAFPHTQEAGLVVPDCNLIHPIGVYHDMLLVQDIHDLGVNFCCLCACPNRLLGFICRVFRTRTSTLGFLTEKMTTMATTATTTTTTLTALARSLARSLTHSLTRQLTPPTPPHSQSIFTSLPLHSAPHSPLPLHSLSTPFHSHSLYALAAVSGIARLTAQTGPSAGLCIAWDALSSILMGISFAVRAAVSIISIFTYFGRQAHGFLSGRAQHKNVKKHLLNCLGFYLLLGGLPHPHEDATFKRAGGQPLSLGFAGNMCPTRSHVIPSRAAPKAMHQRFIFQSAELADWAVPKVSNMQSFPKSEAAAQYALQHALVATLKGLGIIEGQSRLAVHSGRIIETLHIISARSRLLPHHESESLTQFMQPP